MNRVGYSILALFILILVVYNLPISSDAQKTSSTNTENTLLTPTYMAQNLSSQRFNAEGELSHKIKAVRMEHYAELGFMVFTEPRYTIYLQDGSEYVISAREGTLYDDNRMLLEANIMIQSQNNDDFIQQIDAEYVEMNLDTKDLRSNSAITLRGKEFAMQSNGLEANLEDKVFALIDHTRTQFQPKTTTEN